MDELFPHPASGIDPAPRYEADERPAHPNRPWLLVNMIASIDGAAQVAGRSGGLGTPADRAVFTTLRGLADVVLAGAGTVRAEGYGPPRTPEALQARRVERGQAPYPRIAIVSGRLNLDLSAPLFTDTPTRPIVITTSAVAADRRAAAADVAEVIQAGDTHVDVAHALAALREGGASSVTCEGGPTLNASLLEADLVDEWCLSLSPTLTVGTAMRSTNGTTILQRDFRLDRVLAEDGLLLLRYVRLPRQ